MAYFAATSKATFCMEPPHTIRDGLQPSSISGQRQPPDGRWHREVATRDSRGALSPTKIRAVQRPVLHGLGDVTNTGNVPLTSVTLHTPLATLLAPATYTILSLTATGLSVNPGYNGNGNDNLLAAGTTLTPAQSGVVHLVIRVNPQGVTSTYQSSSTATGVAPDTSVVTDISQDGCNVDPDNDGNPGNNSTPTPFLVAVLVPALSMWVLMFLGAMLAVIAVRKV
jgi:hypothetical protein